MRILIRTVLAGVLISLVAAMTPAWAQQNADSKEITDFRVRMTTAVTPASQGVTTQGVPDNGVAKAQELSNASGVTLTHVRTERDGAHVLRHPTALTRAEAWALAEKIRGTSGAAAVEPIDPNFRKRAPASLTALGR
jgi:hypothetical protein